MGDPPCLYNLGVMRYEDGEVDSAAQYFLKAASAGYQLALDWVKELYIANKVSKDEYAHALRSFQMADDEINSDARKKFNKKVADGSNRQFSEGIVFMIPVAKSSSL